MPTGSPPTHRPGRYAVLWHDGIAEPHFDFLLELIPGDLLKAWRLAAWPILGANPAPAHPLPDHRNLYLHYEGPISGDRGSVTRIEGGPCQVHHAHAGYRLRLNDDQALLIHPIDAGLALFQPSGWTAAPTE